MKLDSVRGLKQELKQAPSLPRGFVAPRWLVRAAHEVNTLATRLDRAHTRDLKPTNIAVGVTGGRGRNDYRLGVRIQGRGAEAVALRKEIESRARGEADVRVVRHVAARPAPTPAWFRRRRRPLEPGLSVGQGRDMAGTLGAIVEDDDAYYILSNNHVLANVNRAEPGAPIAQPGDLDLRTKARHLVGVLDRYVPISFSRSNVVDAAIAEIFEDLEFWVGRHRGLRGRMRAPKPVTVDDLGLDVLKAGRTTGITRGRISQVEVDRLSVDMSDLGDGSRLAVFSDQIEIEGVRGSFSADGDSGSLILDRKGHPRALLFCGGPDEEGRDLTWANAIMTVLAKLGVTMVR